MLDLRVNKLAKGLVNYSVKLKKGEKCLIEAIGIDNMLVKELVKEVYNAGGYPFVWIRDNSVLRQVLQGATKESIELMSKYDSFLMQDMDAYIGIRGGDNTFELSDVDGKANELYSSLTRRRE